MYHTPPLPSSHRHSIVPTPPPSHIPPPPLPPSRPAKNSLTHTQFKSERNISLAVKIHPPPASPRSQFLALPPPPSDATPWPFFSAAPRTTDHLPWTPPLGLSEQRYCEARKNHRVTSTIVRRSPIFPPKEGSDERQILSSSSEVKHHHKVLRDTRMEEKKQTNLHREEKIFQFF